MGELEALAGHLREGVRATGGDCTREFEKRVVAAQVASALPLDIYHHVMTVHGKDLASDGMLDTAKQLL